MPHILLLADDSVTIQRLIELTFAHEDIAVVIAADGKQAIERIGRQTPEIVLVDVDLPELDGYELTRHIKQTLNSVPVLLLTGAFGGVDRERAREVGADGVLAKPLDSVAVVTRVKELLSRRRVTATPPPVPERPLEAERLDDYFEQLDRAVTARAGAPPAVPPPAASIGESTADTPGPLLAGAFSALLAAEQSGAAPDAFAEWLPEEPAPVEVAPTAALTEEAIDRIVERVLARLTDGVVHTAVRDAVSSLTSTTAERLVREEIERIKSHIK